MVGLVTLMPIGLVQASSAEMEKLQQQIIQLQQALEQIRADQQSTQEKVVQVEQTAVTSGKGGTLKIGETTLDVGGYVKADLTYSNHGVTGKKSSTGAGYAILATRDVAAQANDAARDRVDLTARESRFYIKTATPVAGNTLKTHLEADFYGADGNELVSNSHGLRLRHAYGSWGNVLIGQTWSTFMDLAALGEINAFGQHASTVFVRQAQVRYTQPFAGGSLMFSLENPEDLGDDQRMPDLVARANFKGDWGRASAGILARELTANDESEWASAYSLSAKLPTVGKDDLRMQFNYGALGRYMGLLTYPDENGGKTGTQAFKSWGASVAYRHFWDDSLRSTLMFSRTGAVDNAYGTTPGGLGSVDWSQSVHLNLMWSPDARIRYGIEYANLAVESAGTEVDVDRIQLSARYLF